jgi:hypothetical protein
MENNLQNSQIKIKKFKHKFLTRKVFIYKASDYEDGFLIASTSTNEVLQRRLCYDIHEQIATVEVTAPLLHWYTNDSDKFIEKIIEDELGIQVYYFNVWDETDE